VAVHLEEGLVPYQVPIPLDEVLRTHLFLHQPLVVQRRVHFRTMQKLVSPDFRAVHAHLLNVNL
jgi:hypothetical protein